MKRCASLLLACVVLVGFTACGGDVETATPASTTSISVPSQTVEPEPSTTSLPEDGAQEPEPDESFLNADLLGLVGQPLTALKESHGDDYYMHGIGLVMAAIEYYDPYILFYVEEGGYFEGGGPELLSEPDPLKREDLEILGFALYSDWDAATGTVAGQDSLRRLFASEEAITYSLLTEGLGQSPLLQHDPDGYHIIVQKNTVGNGMQAVEGGTYSAVYTLGGLDVTVVFTEQGGEYTALRAEHLSEYQW